MRNKPILRCAAALSALTLALVPAAAVASETIAFTYDALGRLVKVAVTGGQTTDYSLDANGNRTLKRIISSIGNNNPIAVSDSANAGSTQDCYLDYNVLTNDSDPDGDPLTVTSVTGNRSYDMGGGVIRIIPSPATFSGTIVAGYTISDGRGGTAGATLTAYFRPGWCQPDPYDF